MKSLSLLIALTMLAPTHTVWADEGTQTVAQKKIAQLKEDLENQRNELVVLEKIRATGVEASQSWGKHVTLALGTAGVALLIKGIKKDANSSLVAGLSTAFFTLGEEAIVMLDERKLEEQVQFGKGRVWMIQKEIAKLGEESQSVTPSEKNAKQIAELTQALSQAKKELASLQNINKEGVKVSNVVGKHLVAIGWTAAAGLIANGLRPNNSMVIAGASLSTLAIREFRITLNDAKKLETMIQERRAVIQVLQDQIDRVEQADAKK